MATHTSILAWEIPWREEPGVLQSAVLQTVERDWASEINLVTYKARLKSAVTSMGWYMAHPTDIFEWVLFERLFYVEHLLGALNSKWQKRSQNITRSPTLLESVFQWWFKNYSQDPDIFLSSLSFNKYIQWIIKSFQLGLVKRLLCKTLPFLFESSPT